MLILFILLIIILVSAVIIYLVTKQLGSCSKIHIGFYIWENQNKPEILISGNKQGYEYLINECTMFKKELFNKKDIDTGEHYHILPKNPLPKIVKGRKVKSQAFIFWPTLEENISVQFMGFTSSLFSFKYYPNCFDIQFSLKAINDLCENISYLIRKETEEFIFSITVNKSFRVPNNFVSTIAMRFILQNK